MLFFWEGSFSPSFFIFCDEGPHLHHLHPLLFFFTVFFWDISIFMTFSITSVDAAWICPDTASVSGPLFFLSENVWSGSYFCLKYLLGKRKLSTSCQDFPSLSSLSPPLVVLGQPSGSFQSWLLSIVPLFLLDIYWGDILCIRKNKLSRFNIKYESDLISLIVQTSVKIITALLLREVFKIGLFEKSCTDFFPFGLNIVSNDSAAISVCLI